MPALSERLLCSCLDVTTRDVAAWMRAGCTDAEQVCRRSGAASHCGSCVQLLTSAVGDPGGRPARAAVELLGPRLAQVTLRPEVGEAFDSRLRPGQHVVLSLREDDGWIARTYTVASAAEDAQARGLLVRLRPDGRMARALTRAAQHRDVGVQVSDPRGEAFARLRPGAPVLFVVAGVGVTPALSALRSTDGPPVRRVVAFFQDEDEALEGALREACSRASVELTIERSGSSRGRAPMGTATAWSTSRAGGQEPADVRALAREHPDADWFVCGPPGFERLTRAHLRGGGVPDQNVHVERFLVAADDATAAPARARTVGEARAARAGLSLAALWLLWMAAPRWDAAAALQSADAWRAVTGSILVATLAWMWVFPTLRMRGSFGAARRLESAHRVVGALSPLVLLLHQRSFGYGLLCVLSALWVFNTVLGCCDKTMIREAGRRERYARLWLPLHVTVSMVVTALAAWHVAMILLFRGGAA